MSTPINPLSKYRSSSYHHILIIADSVDTAVSVSESEKLSTFLRDTNAVNSEGTFVKAASNGGKFVVLINGFTDAQYILSELKWDSITGIPGNNDADSFTSMATEGTMTIEEPRGIRFLNSVNEAYRQMKADPTACVWMVKTIFVGHSDDPTNGNDGEYITAIRPLIFNVVELTGDFSITGGIYHIGFMNINNGSGKLPQIIKITETISIDTRKDPTLDGAISQLNTNINSRYSKYFDETKKLLVDSNADPIPVDYIIQLDDAYKDSRYKITDSQQSNTTEGTTEAGSLLDFSRDITIENAIKRIMKSCPQIKDDIKGNNDEKKRYTYKIRSILNSDNTNHQIIYVINRFEIAWNDIIKRAAQNNVDDSIIKNTITFDYIYSGKNIDVLDFSIKMEMGIVFFQTLINSNNQGNQKEQYVALQNTIEQKGIANSDKVKQADVEDNANVPTKTRLPIFFSSNVKNPETQNAFDPGVSADFQSLLERHAALENLDAKIKIVGNPMLLNSVNKIPKNYADTALETISESDVDGIPVFPHWERVPALAKVNIYMPSTNENDDNYAEQFWYRGFYYVFSITNTFNDGEFTQELEMISLPQPQDKKIDDKIKETNKAESNKAGSSGGAQTSLSQFDNRVGDAPSSDKISSVIDTHATKNTKSIGVKQTLSPNDNVVQ